MLMLPVCTSYSSQLSDLTQGSYLAMSMVKIYLQVIFATGKSFAFLGRFEYIDWAILIIQGLLNTYINICKVKSGQYEEPAKLATVGYFQLIFQLTFDVMFFNTVFSTMQIAGITIVLTAVTVRWGYAINNTFFFSKRLKALTLFGEALTSN
jgi:drug/metabolite transporter (DMT)-like permease